MPKLPTFLKKLMEMLNDSSLTEIISWRQDGSSFQIHKVGEFADTVLPHYFKHNNMASFVRQLNMYGFNRPKDSDQHAYSHSNFKRGNVNSIRYIKRKKKLKSQDHIESSFEGEDSSEIQKSDSQAKLMKECQKLKKINLDLKRENEILIKKLEQFQKIEPFLVKMEQRQEKVPLEKNNEDNASLNKSTQGATGSSNSKKENGKNQAHPRQKRCCVLVLQKPQIKKQDY